METLDEKLNHLQFLQKRRLIRQIKTRFLREQSQRNFTHADLLEIFGLAMKNKIMERPTRHQMPGKHYAAGSPNPAGAKLLRRFIRGSRTEATYYRQMYRDLTGHNVGQTE